MDEIIIDLLGPYAYAEAATEARDLAALSKSAGSAEAYADMAEAFADKALTVANLLGGGEEHLYAAEKARKMAVEARAAADKLTTGGGSEQLQISIKAIIDSVDTMLLNAGGNVTYFDDEDGRIESITMLSEDEDGYVYYKFLNEDWNGQGYGRIEVTRRGTAEGNELVSQYDYYTGTDRKQTVRSYSDTDMTDLVATYTYYNDSYNFGESKTLVTPDAEGNAYYHYINEVWGVEGHGRVDTVTRGEEIDGEISFSYTYYGDSARVKTKTSAVAEYTYANDDANRMITKSVTEGGVEVEYTYYNTSANRMEAKTLASADGEGNIYYHYIDEDWDDQGYGRVDKKLMASAVDGEIAFEYEYYTGSDNVRMSRSYSDSDWSLLVAERTYDDAAEDRVIRKTVEEEGVWVTYTYYNDSGNLLESKTTASPDEDGYVHYHYVNEDWEGQGYGRVDRARRLTALDGEIAFIFEYYEGTDNVERKWSFSDAGCTNLTAQYTHYDDEANRRAAKVIVEDGVETTYTYFNDDANLMESKTLALADALGNVYYKYLNEDWLGTGYGRVEKSIMSEEVDGEIAFELTYYTGTDNIETMKGYSADDWTGLVTESTFYNDGTNLLSSKTLASADAEGNVYYSYLNEDWQGEGVGRVSAVVMASANEDGEIAYEYEYYGDSERVKTKRSYSDAGRTVLKAEYTYADDANNRLAIKVFAWVGVAFLYYNDEFNRVKSLDLASADEQGNVHYSYLNEDWQGQGYGRVSETRLSAANDDGEFSFEYTYYAGTDRINAMRSYNDNGWVAASYNYDESKELVAEYTFYNDEANRRESMTLVWADGDGNAYYHYMNEDWESQGYGRVDIAEPPEGLEGEPAFEYGYYEYYGDSGRIMAKKVYSDASLTVLLEEYTYANDAANRIIKKVVHESGFIITSTYYNDAANRIETTKATDAVELLIDYARFINEDWLGLGYGRVEAEYETYQTEYLGPWLEYTYYSGTDRLKTVRSYAGGTLLAEYTFFDDEANLKESVTLFEADADGNIYYSYLNEDWLGQ
ncbi:MAG: hypothetical protein PHT95_07125, partial [Candidatus Omnitrophica bacterium]|nr:hypothetical protein [Candidatus Omnitrophota bacterium]